MAIDCGGKQEKPRGAVPPGGFPNLLDPGFYPAKPGTVQVRTKDTKSRSSSYSRTRGKKKANGKEPAEGVRIARGGEEVIRLKRTPHAGTRAWATPHSGYARTLTRINVLPPEILVKRLRSEAFKQEF